MNKDNERQVVITATGAIVRHASLLCAKQQRWAAGRGAIRGPGHAKPVATVAVRALYLAAGLNAMDSTGPLGEVVDRQAAKLQRLPDAHCTKFF